MMLLQLFATENHGSTDHWFGLPWPVALLVILAIVIAAVWLWDRFRRRR